MLKSHFDPKNTKKKKKTKKNTKNVKSFIKGRNHVMGNFSFILLALFVIFMNCENSCDTKTKYNFKIIYYFPVDPCFPDNSCQNGGTCNSWIQYGTKQYTYSCQCPMPYIGKHCETGININPKIDANCKSGKRDRKTSGTRPLSRRCR